MRSLRRFCLFIIITLLAPLLFTACATRAPTPLPPLEDRAPPPVTAPQPRSAIPVVDRLLEQANDYYAKRQYEQAIATAERGLRIDRRVPEFYLVLARAYRSLDNPAQARQFAQQGLRYVADDNSEIAGELRFLLAQLSDR